MQALANSHNNADICNAASVMQVDSVICVILAVRKLRIFFDLQ